MKCELFEGCVFFNRKELTAYSSLIEALKDVYCQGNPLLCARRRVAISIGREKVPEDLNPNHTHLVQELITATLAE